ncbi:hypothetical protein RRF57_007547 [Xylaria bambusicola]|uniref:Uncharacterized protein n=1 Tax=Xylaria bambusicola TaxID=326684 RepID=A0AAN7US62_9PEZI
MDVLPPPKPLRCGLPRVNRQRSPSPVSVFDEELDSPRRDTDSISINSMESLPDFMGRTAVDFDNDHVTTVYEAWELSLINDGQTRHSWKSLFGINIGTKWISRGDGCILMNPLVSFEQGELADMHEDAIRGHRNKRGTSQEVAYSQDLANRAYDLPSEVYDRLQSLLEDKTLATNKNPYRKREWRLIVLQPGEFRMTDLLPERKRKSIFSREKKPPVTRTWFIILRGREVKATKENGGWKTFSRYSNPWWKSDKRETKEAREQHKQMIKKMDRARPRYSRYPPPPPPPANPFIPPPRPPMGL